MPNLNHALFAIAIAVFFLPPVANAQTAPERIQKILAFDVNQVPEPTDVLTALKSRPQYASATAQYQALSGMHSALRLTSAIPFSARSDAAIDAAARQLEARLQPKRDAYWSAMEMLKQDIADDRDWKIEQRRYQVPVVREFLPGVVELSPDKYAALAAGAAAENTRLTADARLGVVPLLVYALGGIVLLALAWRRTSRGVADPTFSFEVLSEVGEVMRERQRSETEVSGSISGGGTKYLVGNAAITAPVSGSISSKTTNFQEIFLKMKSGKEQVLNFVDFKVPCREGHRLSVLGVQRHGNAARGCGYHNHNTQEDIFFKADILTAIKPSGSGMAWFSWLAAFSFLTLGAVWFAGEDFSATSDSSVAENAVASGIAIAVLALVPTIVIAVIVKMRSAGNTRKRVPLVIAELQRAVAANEQSLAGSQVS